MKAVLAAFQNDGPVGEWSFGQQTYRATVFMDFILHGSLSGELRQFGSVSEPWRLKRLKYISTFPRYPAILSSFTFVS